MLRGIHNASSTWVGKAIMGTVMGFLISPITDSLKDAFRDE